MNTHVEELKANMIPFSRIHYPVCSFAPFVSPKARFFPDMLKSLVEMTNAVFDSKNMCVGCDASAGKYMACCLGYRGHVAPRDLYNVVETIKGVHGPLCLSLTLTR